VTRPPQATRPTDDDPTVDQPTPALRPRVRTRRRDVSRLRSTTRVPGRPPSGLSRDEPDEESAAPLAGDERRSSRRSRRTEPATTDDGPVILDPTEQRAPAFADYADLHFADIEPLRLALTHRSILHDWAAAGLGAIHLGRPLQSNERLEFLGDAMLGAIVAEELYLRFPDADEGNLTSDRVALVRSETLVRWARSLDLGSYLVLGNGERISDSPRDRILAGAFEALVGAITIDQGLESARGFVGRFLDEDADAVDGQRRTDGNPKGHLQELLQDRYGTQPTYETAGETGPDHDKVFTVEVFLKGERIGTGTGVSKRAAQQDAARSGLLTLSSRLSGVVAESGSDHVREADDSSGG